LPFVFNTLSTVSGPRGLDGDNPPQELADRMTQIWVDFGRTGGLSWPQYAAATRLVHTLDAGVTASEPLMPAELVLEAARSTYQDFM
jgi:para-nitrobenzyl esterase